jgi:hypothetical protein
MNNPPFTDFYQNLQEFWKNNPTGIPGLGQLALPPMSIEELDKRITDLKAVSAWLNLNMNLLHNTIQAMEIQRNTLSALNAFSQPIHHTTEQQTATQASQPDAATLWWQMLQTQFEQIAQAVTMQPNMSTEKADMQTTPMSDTEATPSASPKK